MTGLAIALRVEVRKALASRVLLAASALLLAGIAVLTLGLVAAARGGNERILAQLGPAAGDTGWALLAGVAAQITAAGALLGFGLGLSWLHGREFADRTVTGLFALPVPRATLAVAKLVTHLLWVVLVAAALVGLLTAAGFVLGLGTLDGTALAALGRQFALTVLTGLIAFPSAWAATLGRGILPGIAAAVLILVVAEIAALVAPDAAGWIPLASPALWAMVPDSVDGGQLALVAAVPLVFGALTALAWRRLRLAG